MYPHERSLVQEMENKPFALIGVNSDTDRKALQAVLKQEKITWRSFWNGGSPGGPISKAWQVGGWPTLCLIDAKGVIRNKWEGAPPGNVLDKAVEAAGQDAEKRQKGASRPRGFPPGRTRAFPRIECGGSPGRRVWATFHPTDATSRTARPPSTGVAGLFTVVPIQRSRFMKPHIRLTWLTLVAWAIALP